ncbi:MAG: hypothetical protein LIO96_01495 [Lachnospiraceae bacterium]|nr:hypothetical protein [Lachnospiraceae bacterium]
MMQTEKECRKALHDSVLGLLFKYADLRDELSGVLLSFELMYEEIRNSMEEIQSEMDDLEEHLEACSVELQGFHVQSGSWDPFDVDMSSQNAQTVNTGSEVFESSGDMKRFDEFDDELPFD